jgi:hypothetical protein
MFPLSKGKEIGKKIKNLHHIQKARKKKIVTYKMDFYNQKIWIGQLEWL